MNNTVLTKLNITERGMTVKSIELVDIINQFRKEQNKVLKEQEQKEKPLLQHNTFMAKIREEVKVLELLGLEGQKNFLQSSYINSQSKEQPCFELNRDGMLQMLNSESVLVRYKTIEYINKLEQENNQLNSDNKDLYGIATSDDGKVERQYQADRVHYSINNIEKRLLECNYTNIVATVDKIIEVHTGLYIKDRYLPHQDTFKYGYKGDNLYVNHVKSIIEAKLDKIRPHMVLKDSNINSIMIEKARQLHKEIEASKNITTGKEINRLKKEQIQMGLNTVELINELSKAN